MLYASSCDGFSIRFMILCLLLAGLCSACSGGSAQQTTSGAASDGALSDTGGIDFRIVFQRASSSGAKTLFTPPANACADYGIATIAAIVSDGAATVAVGSWPCSAHRGAISGVPAGSNYSVTVNGMSSGPTPTTIWSGQTTSITVNTGETTPPVVVYLTYVGADTTLPQVVSAGPRSTPTSSTNMPVTDRISIAFSKSMAISTITTSNVTLNYNNAPLPGNVIYDGTVNTAAFVPAAPLSYNADYVLQVTSCLTATTCMTDTQGHPLASDFTATFTTELASGAAPTPGPSGLTVTAGNGQATLDWLASSGSTSYNIYYLSSAGVTTSNGSLISGAQAPAVHLGLSNGTTYYYIVTAVNEHGESPASAEASATPILPAGEPAPPAFSFSGVVYNGTQNTVSWPPVAGATGYNLYWSTRPIFPDKYSADNVIRYVSSPYTHSGLTNGQVCCYIVTTMTAAGESAESLQVCGPGSIQLIW